MAYPTMPEYLAAAIEDWKRAKIKVEPPSAPAAEMHQRASQYLADMALAELRAGKYVQMWQHPGDRAGLLRVRSSGLEVFFEVVKVQT